MAQSNSPDSSVLQSDLELHCHPVNRCEAVRAVRVAVKRDVALQFQFRVTGQIAALKIPAAQCSDRTDELWRHTCAEVFLTLPNHGHYCEYNFSPSSQWAAYEFTEYREGMRAKPCDPPTISVRVDAIELILDVNILLPSEFDLRQIQLGASMVIEDCNQRCCYWALQHDTDKPDFHRRENWVSLL